MESSNQETEDETNSRQ